MVNAHISNPLSNGDGSNPYSDKEDAELRESIDAAKEQFIELNIEESKSKMFQLAKDLAEMNRELADRKGGDPTAVQYDEAATKWNDIAELVLEGTDPTESLQSGSGSNGEGSDIDVDVKQFHEGVPQTTFADVGGYDEVKAHLRKHGIKLVQHRDFLQEELGQSVLNGLILTGPPGTGKTLMAKAFAGELNAELTEDTTLFKVKPGQLKRGVRGESGKLIRGLFAAAKHAQPGLIIFEEIDTLVQDRSDTSVQTMRSDRDLVNAFLDEINEIDTEDVIVMGTTNRADALDDAAIRDKRLNTIEMGLPDAQARVNIFRIHLKSLPEQYVDWENIDLADLAMKADGFTGATIAAVVDNATLTMGLEYKEGERQKPLLTNQDLTTEIANKHTQNRST